MEISSRRSREPQSDCSTSPRTRASRRLTTGSPRYAALDCGETVLPRSRRRGMRSTVFEPASAELAIATTVGTLPSGPALPRCEPIQLRDDRAPGPASALCAVDRCRHRPRPPLARRAHRAPHPRPALLQERVASALASASPCSTPPATSRTHHESQARRPRDRDRRHVAVRESARDQGDRRSGAQGVLGAAIAHTRARGGRHGADGRPTNAAGKACRRSAPPAPQGERRRPSLPAQCAPDRDAPHQRRRRSLPAQLRPTGDAAQIERT